MLSVNFHPFPTLTTERLLLRRIVPADAADLFVLRADENIMRFIPRPLAKTTDDVLPLMQSIEEAIAQNESITWAITLQSENKLIGTIGFVRLAKERYRAEVGYLLHEGYQGRGIMQEALTAVINYGFQDMKLHSIEAIIDPENVASEKLLVRNNFVKEAYFKENSFFEGRFSDSVHYSLLAPK